MEVLVPSRGPLSRVIVIGAGFGGLAAALRLRAQGFAVTVIDQNHQVGGKARMVPSRAGPVAAGPTVLTQREVFDDLFRATGARLEDYATLTREPVLARHFWRDGSRLDLFDDRAASAEAIGEFADAGAARAFLRFAREAETLYRMFDAPMMQADTPRLSRLARTALAHPRHLPRVLPGARLERMLRRRFRDPRLRQLFGRYATYVGGLPRQSPALLALIWRAEEAGVWRVDGGLQALADALARRLVILGGEIRLAAPARRIETDAGRVTGVQLASGRILSADLVVFNGDPRALALGLLGEGAIRGARARLVSAPRSLSARVWSFAAIADGPDLAHHNVFFGDDPHMEFEDLARGRLPRDPTLYLCAQDRGTGLPRPEGRERFEIVLNAAPMTEGRDPADEVELCRQKTFPRLKRFGLTLTPEPGRAQLAMPETFEALSPGSAGSLYGQSPHGLTAALKRPRARTRLRGLYLAGGATHPGAGVPMAALSGRHAAEAIAADLVST